MPLKAIFLSSHSLAFISLWTLEARRFRLEWYPNFTLSEPIQIGNQVALDNLFREPSGDLQSKLVDLDLSDNSVKIKFLNAVYGELGGR